MDMLLPDKACSAWQPLPKLPSLPPARLAAVLKLANCFLGEAGQDCWEGAEAVDEYPLAPVAPGHHLQRLQKRGIGDRSAVYDFLELLPGQPPLQDGVGGHVDHGIAGGLQEAVQVGPELLAEHLCGVLPGAPHQLQLHAQRLAEVVQHPGDPEEATEPRLRFGIPAFPLGLDQIILDVPPTCPQLADVQEGTLHIVVGAVLPEVRDQAVQTAASVCRNS
mmetsp:Transcript_69655/g.207536  ORF Transcript_69655/g.207536 Transcript_69655/m.207536 type:complete len:220 (-) Transcript_69655:452-1111(-)